MFCSKTVTSVWSLEQPCDDQRLRAWGVGISLDIFKKWQLLELLYLWFLSPVWCAFPGGSVGKEHACNARDLGSISGSGRSPGEGNGNLLPYSCLEKSMDRGAWWAMAHWVTKSQTWVQQPSSHTVDPCWLSVLNMAVCICQSQTPSIPLTFPLW